PRALAHYDNATKRYSLVKPMGQLHLDADALEAFCQLVQALDGGCKLPGGQELFSRIRAAISEEQHATVEAALLTDKQTWQGITFDLGVPSLNDETSKTLHILLRAMRERQTIAYSYQPKILGTSATEHSGDEVLEVRMDSSHYYVAVW